MAQSFPNKRSLFLLACGLALALASGRLINRPAVAGAPAQSLNPVDWIAKLEPAQVKPGDKAKLLLSAKIDAGWHMYSLTQAPPPRATRVALADGSAFTLDGKPQQPKPKIAFDPNFEINTETFENGVTLTAPVKVNADAPAGATKLTAKVTYQVCDEHQCLPPRTKSVEADVTILAGAAKISLAPSPSPSPSAQTAKASPSPQTAASPVAAASALPAPETSPTPAATPSADSGGGNPPTNPPASNQPPADFSARLKSRGLLGYIWFALGFGLVALLTPCVFPMIPITVSFFTKKEKQTRSAAIKQALIYCVGIIFTFTVLGLLLTLVAGPAGINRLAANPWLNLFLTTLFAVFALNLFGMFEIRIPSSILTKLDAQSQSGTTAATLLMGLTFTLTSFTCTAAFVGTVLVAATQGEWFWAAIGMFVFATAFAFPFFLLALFPSWLQSLPKSGGWLNSVKVVMGFLELAAAFKFLSNVDLVWGWQTVSRNLVLAAWIALAMTTTIYLLGKFQLAYDSPVKTLGTVRMLSATFFLGIAFYLLSGLFGGSLGELDAFLPPDTGSVARAAAGNTAQYTWLESYDEALKLAAAQKKPAFLNFTGVTCTNCRWMEKNMFPDPAVKKELDRFVLAELFTDRETAEHEQADQRNSAMQEKQFGTVALPLYVIVGPDGKELAKFPGLTRDRNEFLSFLQAGATRYEQIARR